MEGTTQIFFRRTCCRKQLDEGPLTHPTIALLLSLSWAALCWRLSMESQSLAHLPDGEPSGRSLLLWLAWQRPSDCAVIWDSSYSVSPSSSPFTGFRSCDLKFCHTYSCSLSLYSSWAFPLISLLHICSHFVTYFSEDPNTNMHFCADFVCSAFCLWEPSMWLRVAVIRSLLLHEYSVIYGSILMVLGIWTVFSLVLLFWCFYTCKYFGEHGHSFLLSICQGSGVAESQANV